MTREEANRYANEVAAQGIGKYWRTSPAVPPGRRAAEQACLHGREKQRTGPYAAGTIEHYFWMDGRVAEMEWQGE